MDWTAKVLGSRHSVMYGGVIYENTVLLHHVLHMAQAHRIGHAVA